MKMDEEDAINEVKSEMVDLVVLILDFIFSVFLVMLFWNWFVAPLGVVKINFAWALGISLFVGLICDKANSLDSQKEKYNPSKSFYIKLFILLIGYISSFFVGG
ncbi:hypothetical protein KOL65_21945 (plasmid) [Providencia rettgeri]|nr:hypothetical protein [Providencia rettgeri]WHT81901.1 hypothetical protein KOL65_21945 [Providencia rettgeri]